MAILQRYDGQDGIEILINPETGESFCSIRGYARMAGKAESTIRERLKKTAGENGVETAEIPTATGLKGAGQGAWESSSEMAEILTEGGIQGARLISEDLIAEWLPKDNPTAATALLKLGVRVVLHNMAGYEVKSTVVNQQISADQYQSFKHEFETFIPWATEHPIAATIFLERQGITPIVLDPTPVLTSVPTIEPQILPSAETMAALDGAFLNLNRSGLMMNKLFHFLDRIPTMKALDEAFVNDLVESLSQAESLVKKAEGDLKAKTTEYDRLGRENKYLVAQNDLLHSQVDALKDEINKLQLQLPIPVKAAKTKTKVGTKTYRRPKPDQIPPAPLRYALPGS